MPRFKVPSNRVTESKRISALRQTLDFTQRELADEFGVASAAIAHWEAGTRTVPGSVLKLVELYELELGMAQTEPPAPKEVKTSWASRNLLVSKTSGSILAKLAAAGMQEIIQSSEWKGPVRKSTQAAIARQIVEALGEMKGFAMKVGQTVECLDFLMPKEMRRAFSQLRISAPPMPSGTVARVVSEEFGKHPKALFAEWSERPFAVASVGQVHVAKLASGEKVAVKVQYPRIASALEADLRNLTHLNSLYSLLLTRDKKTSTSIEEMRDRFLEECDYHLEASAQDNFRKRFENLPGVVIPAVFSQYSSKRVLVSEFMEGHRLEDFIKKATQEQKNRAGEIIWQFTMESIFEYKEFNSDPHPHNYLFEKDRVVFLDFGSVKRFDGAFIDEWREFVKAILGRDTKRTREYGERLGLVPKQGPFDFDYFVNSMECLYEPWLSDRAVTIDLEWVKRSWEMVMTAQNPNLLRTDFPKDWVFVSRLQWGVSILLGRLGATANWRNKVLDLLYDKDESRPLPLRS